MTIRVVAYGGVDVRGANVNNNDQNVNRDGNAWVVEAGPNDTVLLKVDRNGEGFVEVPPLPDYDRAKGWRRLNSANNNVLAYGVDDDKVVLLPKPDQNWMGALPDDRALADVTLPGTHESAAFSGGFISQCQDHDIRTQLEDGCRFFDIRLRLDNGELKTYHGIQAMHGTLQENVDWVEEFLRNHNREAVVMSIKQEAESEHDFPVKVEETLTRSGMWRFDENLPTLGEVRGKGIYFCRANKTDDSQFRNGQGIRPTGWPDNKREGHACDIHGTELRVHDWYDTDHIADKAAAAIQFLEPTLQPRGNGCGSNHPFSIDFITAAKFPQAPPQYIASGKDSGGVANLIGATSALFSRATGGDQKKTAGPEGGVNTRVTRWLLQQAFEGRRPRATIMMDFYRGTAGQNDGGMALLLAALNFINVNE